MVDTGMINELLRYLAALAKFRRSQHPRAQEICKAYAEAHQFTALTLVSLHILLGSKAVFI
jgi:hypothetical protein